MVSTTVRIPKVTVADVELDDWTLPDEAITDGNPVAKGKLLWQSDDKRLANGVWSCEPGSFNWEYTWDETIYFIEGEVVITDQDGNSATYRAGDLFYVPIGTMTHWKVVAPVRKAFHFCSDDPVVI